MAVRIDSALVGRHDPVSGSESKLCGERWVRDRSARAKSR